MVLSVLWLNDIVPSRKSTSGKEWHFNAHAHAQPHILKYLGRLDLMHSLEIIVK